MTPSAIRPVIVSSFSPPALACIRSWGRQGFPVGMVCVGSGRAARPASKYLVDFVSLAPGDIYRKEGLQVIDAFLKRFNATGVVAINEDVSCRLNDNRRCFGPQVAVWAPPSEVLRALISKRGQIEAARRANFDLLPTYLLHSHHDVDEIPPQHYPLCLRPDDPGKVKPTFKVLLVHSADELSRFMTSLESLKAPIVAQPFQNLPNLVVHGARSISGRHLGLQAFLVERKFQGVTLTLRPADLDGDLRKKCIHFLDAYGLTGNYHFELLSDSQSGKLYFLEINARLGGTTAKVFALGYDEPLLALQAYGVCESAPQGIRNTMVSSKHALLKYSWYAIRGMLTPLDYPQESRKRRLREALCGLLIYRDEVLSSSDLPGSLAFYRAMLGGSFGP